MQDNRFDVSGKTVLVTGSSRGLGFAYAEGFLRAGAKVILNGRDGAILQKEVDRLRGEGLDAYGAQFDVSAGEAVRKEIERITREIAPIDVLVNNAGIHRRHPLMEMTDEDFRKVLDINLTGAFLVGQAVAKTMKERGGGKIINITSLNAVMARPNIGNYCASKGGLTMLTKSMATEWSCYGITCNAVAPGYIGTELTRPLMEDPQFDAWVKSEIPLGRWGKTEDVVGTVLFLASSASDYINGTTIFVDGGWQASL